MPRKLRKFPLSWLLAIVAAAGLAIAWQQLAARRHGAAGADEAAAEIAAEAAQAAPVAPAPGTPTISATQLVDRAILALDQYAAISARVRHRSQLLGQEILASGEYEQGPAASNLSRLEMKFVAGDEVSNLEQVCDGQFLWTRRHLPGETKLTRVELGPVFDALAAQPPPPAHGRPLAGLGVGGLPKLLRQLQASFDFERVQAVRLGDLKAWQVEGKWTTARLGQLLPDQQVALGKGELPNLKKLPDHAPDRVLLYLGQSDLFPYRFDFRRAQPEQTYIGPGSKQRGDHSVQTWDFYQVRLNGQVNPLHFIYEPGVESYKDETDRIAAEVTATMVVY